MHHKDTISRILLVLAIFCAVMVPATGLSNPAPAQAVASPWHSLSKLSTERWPARLHRSLLSMRKRIGRFFRNLWHSMTQLHRLSPTRSLSAVFELARPHPVTLRVTLPTAIKLTIAAPVGAVVTIGLVEVHKTSRNTLTVQDKDRLTVRDLRNKEIKTEKITFPPRGLFIFRGRDIQNRLVGETLTRFSDSLEANQDGTYNVILTSQLTAGQGERSRTESTRTESTRAESTQTKSTRTGHPRTGHMENPFEIMFRASKEITLEEIQNFGKKPKYQAMTLLTSESPHIGKDTYELYRTYDSVQITGPNANFTVKPATDRKKWAEAIKLFGWSRMSTLRSVPYTYYTIPVNAGAPEGSAPHTTPGGITPPAVTQSSVTQSSGSGDLTWRWRSSVLSWLRLSWLRLSWLRLSWLR